MSAPADPAAAALAPNWRKAGRPNLWVREATARLQIRSADLQPAAPQSYAQCGEDLILAALIRARSGPSFGFAEINYIDIGAGHPVSTSNSFLFYQHGASGVLVEPNPELAALLRQARPRDLVVDCAVAASGEGEALLHRSSKHEVAGLNQVFVHAFVEAKGGPARGWTLQEPLAVRTTGLQTILALGDPSRPVKVLCIDIEGDDLQLLLGADFTHWRPDWLVVEHGDGMVGAARGSQAIIAALAQTHGYSLAARTEVNLIFGR